MQKEEFPITQAVRFLRANRIEHTPHLYPYVDHGGTGHAAETLHVPEHRVIKTLVMEIDERNPLIVLMHGDREVSTKQLARQLDVKHVVPCDMKKAERLTGYRVGGISPFGTRTKLKVCMEASIMDLDMIYINGGKRGFMVEVRPSDLVKALEPVMVNVAIAV